MRSVGVSVKHFWRLSRLQSPARYPTRYPTLHKYSEALIILSKALLRLSYPGILNRKLARANLRLRLLLDGVKGHAFFTVSGAGLVTSWNRGAERMFGHAQKDVLGQHFARFFTPEDIQAGAPGKLLQQADRDGRVTDQGWQVRKDGSRFFAEGLLTALGTSGSREFGRQTNDVTDRRNNEEALLQTQKLESIGVLASGIAHDFNNLLTTIMCGLSFALANLTPDHPSYQSLVLAERSSEKAADLTHQLLAYAGQGKFVVTRFDLSALIGDLLTLLRTSIPKYVTLQLALEPDLMWIEGDASQIQQIVMNLVINGAESIGPEGGSLWVSTGLAPAEKRASSGIAIAVAPVRGDGGEVFMEVRDSGS